MEIKVIELAAVDADAMNPRDDFGDIDALAESFSTGIWPGEPVQPIVVVADGARWRIVDGERRYRAMRSLGRGSCHAVCCEGLDEANCVVAMLATDDKKELSDVERSRGVQQALLLGVAPEKVEKAGRFSGAAAVKRAMQRVADANKAAQMPLEQLVAIDEAERAGDVEGAAEIAEAGKSWQAVAQRMERRRKREAEQEAWTEKCKTAGVNLALDEGDVPEGYSWTRRLTLDDDLSDLPADAVVRWDAQGVVFLYLLDEDADAEESEEMRLVAKCAARLEVEAARLDEELWARAVNLAFERDCPPRRARIATMWAERALPEKDLFKVIANVSETTAASAKRRMGTYTADAQGAAFLVMFINLKPRIPSYLIHNLANGCEIVKWDKKTLSEFVRIVAEMGITDADALQLGFGELLTLMKESAAPCDADGGTDEGADLGGGK